MGKNVNYRGKKANLYYTISKAEIILEGGEQHLFNILMTYRP